MSKSRGNALSPQDVLKQHGADVIRLWVAMIDYQTDMTIGPQIMGRSAEAYRKIRNTARYLLSNLFDFDPERDAVPHEQLLDVDKWVLARAAEVFERCRRAYEEYEFHVVYHRVLELCTVVLSSLSISTSRKTRCTAMRPRPPAAARRKRRCTKSCADWSASSRRSSASRPRRSTKRCRERRSSRCISLTFRLTSRRFRGF